jgi:trk system potassium uptake protein TrkA
MKQKQYAVLGLGIFGSTIAKTLSEYNCEVIALDKEVTCVDRASEFVTQAVLADFTDIEQLRAIGIGDCEVAVVASGSRLEESIMAIMNLKPTCTF